MKTIDPAEIEAKGCRWIRTDDDRIVEYSVVGSERPDARVLVTGYFAGQPLPPSWLEAYETLNIKAIDVSYPGLGLSSVHLGRKVIDWPVTDLEPVLQAEGVGEFTIYGASYGTPHAIAVAQRFGPERVKALGLRVPYFGLPLSEELGLPDGQFRLPTTEEFLRNTWKVKAYRLVFRLTGRFAIKISEPGPFLLRLMKSGVLGPIASNAAKMAINHPELLEMVAFANRGIFAERDTIFHIMTQDVGLDLPGVDPRAVDLSGDRVVIWYATDDEDCPPSHGEWLAKHFSASTRVLEDCGHVGGAFLDQPQFLEGLMGRP